MSRSFAHEIEVDIGKQSLVLRERGGRVLMETSVSTARNGAGERVNSERTPRGRHIIRAKIGGGQPANAVFVSRRPTGEIYSPALRTLYPSRDWILTRILWLSGLEPGRNRFGDVDTMRRYVYIHGCPDEDPMGTPGSRGCIKMRNLEVIRLYELVAVGTPISIKE
jgi:L,D-transpeptidase YbiS